jgi:hypothetical protein
MMAVRDACKDAWRLGILAVDHTKLIFDQSHMKLTHHRDGKRTLRYANNVGKGKKDGRE